MATVTIDARLIRSGGIGSYLQSLLSDLEGAAPAQHEYRALVRPLDATEYRDWKSVRPVPLRTRVYSPVEHLTVPLAVPRGSVLHVPHYNVPIAFSGPLVATIHDLIHLEFPENFRSRAAAWYARQMILAAAQKARRIITGSNATRTRLTELCGVPESKIHVIPYRLSRRLLAAAPDVSVLSLHGLEPQSYFLYVGQFKVHKNIPGLFDAFAGLAAVNREVRLVAIAYVRDRRFDLALMAALRGLADRVVVLQNVDFASLRALYENAIALVQPSFVEGFGLPIIEAMALGTPVIASRIPAHEEAAGKAATLVNPRSTEEVREAMAGVWRSHTIRQDLAQRGYDQARRFTEIAVGAYTAKVYEEALS